MPQMNSDYVVKYFEFWIEENFDQKILHIKMELCSQNLEKFLKNLKAAMGNNLKDIYFFISLELFKELTECLKYLHSIHIIHRDLKPKNVLISDGSNERFLKLCDFNISRALGIKEEDD